MASVRVIVGTTAHRVEWDEVPACVGTATDPAELIPAKQTRHMVASLDFFHLRLAPGTHLDVYLFELFLRVLEASHARVRAVTAVCTGLSHAQRADKDA